MHAQLHPSSLREILALALGACAILVGSPGGAQTLGQPSPAQPLGQPQISPIGPRLVQPASAIPQVRGDLGQRSDRLPRVPERGPAMQAPQHVSGSESPSSQQPVAPVTGPTGLPIAGAIRIAPNRIYHPASQRYYWTSGPGTWERVLP